MKPVCLWTALVAALLALVGCSLTQGDRRKDEPAKAMVIGGSGAGLVASKQAALVIWIASRPVDDEALGSAVWDAADEQMVPPELQKALRANGLRLGVLSGELPKELRAVLDAPPPKRIDPMTVVLPDGESTMIDLASEATRTLKLSRPAEGSYEKTYADVHGFFRLTAKFDEAGGVGLRFVPELHHGPIRRNWTPAPTIGSMAPAEFAIRDGQQEETIADLKSDVVLQPGQVAVLSGRPEAKGGLGDFLFGGVEGNSNRPIRRVLLVSAMRSDTGSAPGPRAVPPRLEPVEAPEAANPAGR